MPVGRRTDKENEVHIQMKFHSGIRKQEIIIAEK